MREHYRKIHRKVFQFTLSTIFVWGVVFSSPNIIFGNKVNEESQKRINEFIEKKKKECGCPEDYIVGQLLLSPNLKDRERAIEYVRCMHYIPESMCFTCDIGNYKVSCIDSVYRIKKYPFNPCRYYINVFIDSLNIYIDQLINEMIKDTTHPPDFSNEDTNLFYDFDGSNQFIIKAK